jgi:histidinol-phosphatase
VESDLSVARRAALAGAAVGLRHFAALAGLPREYKADGSVVTEADRAVELAIRQVLSEARPQDSVLGEEHGLTGNGDRRWIVDPIDGTALFVAGDDRWLVLVALEEAGEIVVGVAAVPAQHRIWWAERGSGAHEATLTEPDLHQADPTVVTPHGTGPNENDPHDADRHSAERHSTDRLDGVRRISVAERPDVLDGSRLGLIPAGAGLSPAEHERFAPLRAVTEEVPWRTHAALLVACGELDLALQARGEVWDFAATSLIVEEAGGSCGDTHGEGRPTVGPALFARSPALHTAARKLIP